MGNKDEITGEEIGKKGGWKEDLQAAASGVNRKGVSVIRDNFSEIQEWIEKGLTRKEIYDSLKKDGFRLKFQSFLQTLKVVRKEMKSASQAIPTPQRNHSASTGTFRGNEPQELERIVRPPGVTPAAWAEMQQKHKEEQRRLNKLKGITK